MQQWHYPFRSGSQHAFSSYLHQLSHDMRTPLNHISGFAELLLLDARLGEVQRQYAEAILDGGHLLKEAVVEHFQFMEAVMSAIQSSPRTDLETLSDLRIRARA